MRDLTAERFGAFFDRLQTERIALKIVNVKFSDQKLHGLTESAISVWACGAVRIHSASPKTIGSIVEILMRLSTRIGALADQSRTVFSGEGFGSIPCHEILSKLEDTCRCLESSTKSNGCK